MTWSFPNLTLTPAEWQQHEKVGKNLVMCLLDFFRIEYELVPEIMVSGSTQKRTALPGHYFGTDLDIAVLGHEPLLKRIAYQNDVFEGCQLFSLDFAVHFAQYFGEVYFAGHRLSGTFEGYPFDFSVADTRKDPWKWAYNTSTYVRLRPQQIHEIQKAKYFLKTFNVAGSEIYGVVGPAVELGIYHHDTFRKWLQYVRACQPIPETPRNAFTTIPFPTSFMSMYPPSKDHIHQGLVKSFRYTMPNTFNRLLEAVSAETLDISRFLERHQPRFNYSRNVVNHNRLVVFVLGAMLRDEPPLHIDILPAHRCLRIYASVDERRRRTLDRGCDVIDRLATRRDMGSLPDSIESAIAQICDTSANYEFFVGMPHLPLRSDTVYIPFDFLMRSDAQMLIKVMEDGQRSA